MERETLLRLYFKSNVKTLIEKAELIFEKHQKLGEALSKQEWYLSDRTFLDGNDKELICQAILKSFKKTIKRTIDWLKLMMIILMSLQILNLFIFRENLTMTQLSGIASIQKVCPNTTLYF